MIMSFFVLENKFESGVTLVEVLVAVFIFSIGLLGLASLQISSLQSVHFSYQTTVANLAAVDVRERLWRSVAIDQPCPSDPTNIANAANGYWSSRADVPGLVLEIENDGLDVCEYRIRVWWQNDRFAMFDAEESPENFAGRNVRLSYYVKIPDI